MATGKCTFGVRMPIDIVMLNEIILREVKNFRNYKIYRPCFSVTPLDGKFYAAHDQIKLSKELEQKEADYSLKVATSRAKGPKSKYTSPATENQTYGWYSDPLISIDRSDTRLYNPLKESSHTKIEIRIQVANPKSRKS